MEHLGSFISNYGLENHGLKNLNRVHWNYTAAQLYEEAIARGEAVLSAEGPLVAITAPHTGRSPNDKFTVREATTEADIWWGKVNADISPEKFDQVATKVRSYLQNRDLFVFDGYVGTDTDYRMPVRIITEYAWHNLFAQNMFVRETDPEKLRTHIPQFTVIDVATFKGDPKADEVNSDTFVLLNFAQKLVLIGGTKYAGEIKKSIFTAMNYYLPKKGVMSMHCSANYGETVEDTALFFGLSGTGKTTLSNDTSRHLIGDDEHGWSDNGVFNFEGGCYAKVIRLDPEGEPEIYATTKRFGTILENVILNEVTRIPDLDDGSITENTRASYPMTQILNADLSGQGGHPKNIFFLTADAFGVLPPISKLTPDQTQYHFLSGYTAKVAGTERGVTEPKATFSACFGAPFMPLHPGKYAALLAEKVEKHGANVWLINTGWTGGPYGVGSRMKLAYTRRMITAALTGELDDVAMEIDPIFGLAVPQQIDGVPANILTPRNSWEDTNGYDLQAAKLAQMFIDNFVQFADGVSDAVKATAPVIPELA